MAPVTISKFYPAVPNPTEVHSDGWVTSAVPEIGNVTTDPAATEATTEGIVHPPQPSEILEDIALRTGCLIEVVDVVDVALAEWDSVPLERVTLKTLRLAHVTETEDDPDPLLTVRRQSLLQRHVGNVLSFMNMIAAETTEH